MHRIPANRFRTFVLLNAMAVLCLTFFAHVHVFAADIGITIQTSRSTSYKHTQPLTKPITGKLGASEDSDDPAMIGRALRQLGDGDILVLAIHSNPDVFGLGKNVVEWKNFWRSFGIARPPQLASVIIGGCMSNEFGEGDNKRYVHVTEKELESIRSIFNAKTLFAPGSEIMPPVAINDTDGILGSLLAGKKLADINLQKRWHYVAGPGVNKNSVTLKDLRGGNLRDCLCRCLEPKGGRMSCRYDPADTGTSPSCRNLKNGPCFCKAAAPSPGCSRRQLPGSGDCYTACMKQYGGR